MAFERLRDSSGTDFAPAPEDLAFFVAEDGWHGLLPMIPAQIRYWQKRRQFGQDHGEAAVEGLADQMLAWLTLDGQAPDDYDLGIFVREDREGLRRTVLGGLAASLGVRANYVFDAEEEVLIDARGSDANPVIINDMSIEQSERQWPEEPRMHYVLAEAPQFPDTSTRDVWYRKGRLLLCRRYPGDVAPAMGAELSQLGMEADPQRTVTVLPHLAALHSPQFSTG